MTRKLVTKHSDYKRESFLIIRRVKRIETSCFNFFAHVFSVLCTTKPGKPSSINIGTSRSWGVNFLSVARNFSNDAWYRGELVFQKGLNLEETEDNEWNSKFSSSCEKVNYKDKFGQEAESEVEIFVREILRVADTGV